MSLGTILYIGGFEMPDRNAAAHRVLGNAKALRELGYKVVFLSVDKSKSSEASGLSRKEVVQGFDCYSTRYPSSKKEWLVYLTDISVVEDLLPQLGDVKHIIAYNYQAVALMRLRPLCKKQGIKLIGDCTEWYNARGSGIAFWILKGFDSFLRMRILHKRLDGLIVISAYLKKYYKSCPNVVRIPPLVDVDEEKWKAPPYRPNPNKIRFVYSGSPGKHKDKINLFIEALFNLDNKEALELVIAGLTKDDYLVVYPDHARILDELNDYVIFLGRISHQESIDLLKSADYSILIRDSTKSTRAGFPTKFVESVTCKVKVIATDSSDLSEYLSNSDYGLLLKNGKDSLNSTLLELSTRETSHSAYGTNDFRVFNYLRYLSLFGILFQRL